jgi:poly(A) polymerase
LLSGADPAAVRRLDNWVKPRFPLTGGDLIALGLPPGPVVARTLQAVERDWVEGGFAEGEAAALSLARRHVDQALRSSQ